MNLQIIGIGSLIISGILYFSYKEEEITHGLFMDQRLRKLCESYTVKHYFGPWHFYSNKCYRAAKDYN
jgi:hypothetical protein